MEETMSKERVLEETIKILNNISLPAGLSIAVGTPICHAVNNLQVLREMLQAEKQKKDTPEEKPAEEPERTSAEEPEEAEETEEKAE